MLKWYKCPMMQGENNKKSTRFLCKCLDLGGGGFVCGSDLEWPDKWKPSAWLTAVPDEAAWLHLRGVLLEEFGHILKAWRFELDADNSNRLSWQEFCDACKRLKFAGNMGGAWRWLDKELVGWISLAAVDMEASDILHSF